MILTARDLTAEPEWKREPAEMLPVANILQTRVVRKMGLAFVIRNGGFRCSTEPSACLLVLPPCTQKSSLLLFQMKHFSISAKEDLHLSSRKQTRFS